MKFDISQPTCAVIHEEYERAYEHELVVEDDLLLSAPPPLFLDIIGDFVISDCPCVSPSMDASTSNLLQNIPNVSTSFDNREDKFFIENPLDFSSAFSRNIDGEHSCFSSTPLYDSSNHEDADKHLEFYDRGCHDICTY